MKYIKTIAAILTSIILIGIFAQAQLRSNSLSLSAQDIADRLLRVENSLNPRDYQEIRYSLDQINYLLDLYDDEEPTSPVTCVSNGAQGSFEKFYLTDIDKNIKLGGQTSAETCQLLLSNQRLGLICVSNGAQGSFEKFNLYDRVKSRKIGGETALNTCFDLIRTASRDLTCASNGAQGSFEKFNLYDRVKNRKVGGETSMQNCLASLPK